MIKYLLIIFNSFILFIYGIFNGDNGLSVTSKIPNNMVGGTEVPIEITVTKGAMNGFAKLQLELPAEFQVKEVEEKGATYTFNEGIAKWVWAALPTESEIVIKLIVIPAGDNLGPKTISAKYSYVENNVKQVVEMSPAEINVITQADADRLAAGTPAATSTPSETPAAAVTTETTSTATSLTEPPSSIVLSRTINRVSPTVYEVAVKVAKGATKGFARYSDVLPPDVEVKKSMLDGASFSVADGKIKFVWANVPEKDTLSISYFISSSRIQAVELKGEYSYLEDNQSKKQDAQVMSIAFETPAKSEEKPAEEPVAQAPAEVVTKPTEAPVQTKPTIAVKEPKKATPKPEKKPKPVKEKPVKPEVDNTQALASANGMVYHVQIGAFTKKTVTAAKLEKKFNVTERINSEMAEGFTKFMVGNHGEYKEARDHREVMISDHKIRSSFVVAYNNGKRITVQEALSITNQKWYK